MELLEGMLQREKDEFKRLCNRLLSICFVCKADIANRADYYFIIKHKECFSQYLNVLGYRLEINEEYGVIQLTNAQNYNRVNLKLFESIILLILRILYDEKKRELSVSDRLLKNWRYTERDRKKMKNLQRMKLINWHRFENCTIEFGDATLISGENGAGKSTLLDAIQFVVTCSTNYFNKAAHENGKRKLTGYIRCKTGKENRPYEREGEISAHIALEFYEESRNRYFIIGAVIDSAQKGRRRW